jgi:hypothetical protein
MERKDIKAELNKQSKEELVNLIDDLYNKYKPVKDYFVFQKYLEKGKLLDEYKTKIKEGFHPPKNWAVKISRPLLAIKEFKSHEPLIEPLIDLLLYFVECGIEFSNEYGNMVENLFDSIEEIYTEALELLENNNLLEKFRKRCNEIVVTSKKTGWGFYGVLNEIYSIYYKRKLKKGCLNINQPLGVTKFSNSH